MMDINSPSKTFSGVRFVLFGFSAVEEHKVRSKLVASGGVDVGQYGQNFTHLIVNNIVYDDPLCVAARNDGKTVVTGLWVDHSFDIGMPVDATSVMYRPPKDLNGIPGAKSLIICLTGYQRQDREDIMTMVGLMGAQFSKPLVAYKVTHLICYKFEGEKYELARRTKTIKIVNHRWLEDCLRDWELLPEANYDKSGYELEITEASAKDSEDEAETTAMNQSMRRNLSKSPQSLINEIPVANEVPKVDQEASAAQPKSNMREDPTNSISSKEILTPSKEKMQGLNFEDIDDPAQKASEDIGYHKNDSSYHLCDMHEETPKSRRIMTDLASISRNAGSPFLSSGAKSNALSYSRKTLKKSPINANGLFKGKDAALTDIFNNSTSKVEPRGDSYDSFHLEAPFKIVKSHGAVSAGPFHENRVESVPAPSSKSQMSDCSNEASTKESTPVKYQMQGTERDLLGLSMTESLSLNKTSLSNKIPVSKSLTSLNSVAEMSNKKTAEAFPCSGGLSAVAGEVKLPHDQEQNPVIPPLTGGRLETEKSDLVSNSGSPQRGKSELATEPPKRRAVANRAFVRKSSPELSWAKLKGTSNQKSSICSSKTLSNDELANSLTESRAVPRASNARETCPPADCESLPEIATKVVSGIATIKNLESLDDETQPPEENDEHKQELDRVELMEVEKAEKPALNVEGKTRVQQVKGDSEPPMPNDSVSLDNRSGIEPTKAFPGKKSNLVKGKKRSSNMAEVQTVITVREEKKPKKDLAEEGESEVQQVKGDSEPPMPDDKVSLDNRKSGSELKKALPGKKSNLVKGKKRSSNVAEVQTVPTVGEEKKAKEDLAEQGNDGGKDIVEEKKMSEMDNSTRSNRMQRDSVEAEKENRPNSGGIDNSSPGKVFVDAAVESAKTLTTMHKKSRESILKPTTDLNNVTKEPRCFILSGHRFQRKEYQQIIKRLKGKCCRDSHQWSYQATHFITPAPRRTEKFFAAAASGRWILKSDYLTACQRAGSFLPEEPYEWHKTGISEDGAINLEAPRKWRILREKTGHGAFYGMQIIVHGDCILPPRDTLKRVVKAGDGTILATSPPYTRFLNAGIDFAIISPGVPRDDIWVQEFIKHEIPCVLADYLVEYVCKPDQTLSKYVLYDTHAWADKSLSKLKTRAEELIDEAREDVACQVCGNSDRGDVMLICGDESGSEGCGSGMHIYCCDPPLQAVPESDWFCPKCSDASKDDSVPSKRRK